MMIAPSPPITIPGSVVPASGMYGVGVLVGPWATVVGLGVVVGVSTPQQFWEFGLLVQVEILEFIEQYF